MKKPDLPTSGINYIGFCFELPMEANLGDCAFESKFGYTWLFHDNQWHIISNDVGKTELQAIEYYKRKRKEKEFDKEMQELLK